jgi:predicted nucleotidyltransferase component of viral defense system
MKLDNIRDAYLAEGFSYLDASSRTCQDIVLALIAQTPFIKNITIKGGVVMQHLSGDRRRATQDIDFDFIRYSLSEDSIRTFINKLSEQSKDISISIISAIEELKHQDYKGKRVHIRITDSDNISIVTKLDIGVHKDISMEQDMYCFDLGKLDDSVTLLINTKEQILDEKLKVLLRLGSLSTRYKDIFDMYWLIVQGDINRALVLADIISFIFDDATIRENNIAAIILRLEKAFDDSHFIMSLNQSKRHNWLEIDPVHATSIILKFIQDLYTSGL